MPKVRAFVILAVGLAVVLVGWAAWRLESSPSGGQTTSAFAGAPAPDFTLTVFDTGETITLSELRGRPVTLDFFASWCPSCRAEAPLLEGFWQRYEDSGLILLGVALNDSAQGLRDFKDEFLLTFPMGLDQTGSIAAMYRAVSIPTFVMIDREGRVANLIVGPVDDQAMAAEAEALLR